MCSESEARQNAIGSLVYDASSDKFDASQHQLSEAIFYFNPYKLNFIAIGYRKDLCMFNSYHLRKQFKKLRAAVCACFCNLWGEGSIGVILVFPCELL